LGLTWDQGIAGMGRAIRLGSGNIRAIPSERSRVAVVIEKPVINSRTAKVATARNLWVPAVNNHGGFGRWAFVEATDPWDVEAKWRQTAEEGAR
jgi:hypothetical protein